MESHKGFIVLVDISGYTNFVSRHNIDSAKNKKLSLGQAHAEHIISDLLEKVINELDGVLTINKLQGDAALFYAVSESHNNLSDNIIKKLQTSFEVFNQRLSEIKFCEACTCGTCADVGNLKLKSFVHFGEFLIKKINQFKEIAGQDVILAHRLMKNSIGVSEYMLFTKSFTEIKDLNTLGLVEERKEKYDDIGKVDCTVFYPDKELYNIELAKRSGHTRFPLCVGDLDQCIGLVHIKDIFHSSGDIKKMNLRRIKRNIIRVMPDESLDNVMQKLMHSRTHMALVLDEFGGITGVITLEGIIETIVGSIQDEFDFEEEHIKPNGIDNYLVSGLTPIHEFEEILSIEVENEEVSTVGGLIISELGHIPLKQERFRFNGLDITITEVDEKRVIAARVRVIERKDELNKSDE